jgi:hypothetical protein
MVWWIVLKFKAFPGNIYFQFEFRFTYNFLKVAFVQVRFSPGFFSGGGFFLEQFAPACC